MISFSSSPFYVCSHLTLVFLPLSLTFQPWRILEAIPPLRLSGSHLTRSITLCLFQLNLTPFAVRSIVIPCRKVTQPYCTHFPGGGSLFLDVYYVITRRSVLSDGCPKVECPKFTLKDNACTASFSQKVSNH